MNALISVVVPCYRQAKYLNEAVQSLAAQTYEHWECIVVNDGSPDETREVATRLAQRDSRIRYIEQANGGPASARNRALADARGDFVQFLDADDLLLQDNFGTMLSAAGDAGTPCVIVSDFWLMDETGRRYENRICAPEFKFGTAVEDMALRWETELSIPPSAMLFDARFFRNYGIRFSETLPNHEDWDCWMRILMLHPNIVRVRQKHSVYRVHRESLTRRGDDGNWSGFRQAIDLQIKSCSGDLALRRMLVYKRKLTDDFYGKSLRVRVLERLRRSPWFAKLVPQAVREFLCRRLDLQNLHAHGWLS